MKLTGMDLWIYSITFCTDLVVDMMFAVSSILACKFVETNSFLPRSSFASPLI